MQGMAKSLEHDQQVESILRNRSRELGIEQQHTRQSKGIAHKLTQSLAAWAQPEPREVGGTVTDDRDIELDDADSADDPAQAFEAMRLSVEKLARDVGSEMTVIRKGVEAAFEEFEKYQHLPEYSPDLSWIVQQFAAVGDDPQAVEQLPLLRQGAQHCMAVLERGRQNVVSSAVQQIEHRAGGLERMTNALTERVGSARMRGIQNRWL